MSVTYGFYNSKDGDRKYSADDFSGLFSSLIPDGIFKGYGDEFKVTPATGATVKVGSGRAWFNGTWTYNDSDLLVDIPVSQLGLRYNIHIIVIEVDTKNRVNSIKCLTGGYVNGTSTYKIPELSNGENGVYQYPICRIAETSGMTEITNNNITNLIGDSLYSQCPQLIDTSIATVAMDGLSVHRNTFRGKYLGSSITSAQLEAIRKGDFSDFYIGDYWRGTSYTWRIADINYFKNTGDPKSSSTKLTKPHLVLAATNYHTENALALVNINGGTLASGVGYDQWPDYEEAESYLWDEEFPSLFGTSKGIPPSALLSVRDYDVTSFANPTQANNFKADVGITLEEKPIRLLNEPMVFGSYIHAANGNNRMSIANRQLALFRLCNEYINQGFSYWLRDIESVNSLVMVHDSGAVYAPSTATNPSAYFRPFIVIG